MTQYNPARWICAYSAAKCEGKFLLRGDLVPCPLRHRCHEEGAAHTPYEFAFDPEFGNKKLRGMYPSLHDPKWNAQHKQRYNDLLQCFKPEKTKEYQGKNAKRRQQERADDRPLTLEEIQQDELEGEERILEVRGSLLPCGEDCKNCPWEDCRYSDDDFDALLDRQDKDLNARKHRRRRERMATDPAYRERERKMNRERCRRHYAGKKTKKEMEAKK